MSQANVEIVRLGLEAAIHRPKPDWARMAELFHPNHEFISRYDALEGGGSRRGAAGYRDWLINREETVQSQNALGQVTEIDKSRVLAIMPTSILGKSSGLALHQERMACIVTVRDGKIVRTEVYGSPEEALEAVGMER
jgi:ketosteroid isomerase-like protein